MAKLDSSAAKAVKHAGVAAEQVYEAVKNARVAAGQARTKAKKLATQMKDKVTGRAAARKRKTKIAAAVVGTAAAVAVGVGAVKARNARKSRKR